jgi:tetratricopeptide (TPR) repeat protein
VPPPAVTIVDPVHSMPSVPVSSTPAVPAAPAVTPPGIAATAARKDNRWLMIGTGIVAVAAVAAGLWVVNGSAPPSAPVEQPAPAPLEAATPVASAPLPESPVTAAPGPMTAPAAPPAGALAAETPTPGAPPAKAPPKGAVAKGSATAAAPTAPPAPSKDAEAAERLEVARAKLASNLVDPAVADLRQIVLDYPGSAVAVEASFLAGDALEKAGRAEDAMAVYVEFDRRFAGNPRVAGSKLRRARLLLQSRAQPRQNEGYALMGEVARDFPRTPEARAALQARRQVESQRRQLRAMDPVLNIEVPALLVTLRMMADQFPGEPATMVALHQLAAGYEDLDQYQAAADALEQLTAQFQGNPMEVWFRLGELYERRLRNPDKARQAYERVPADSPRYRDAQQRLKRK